MPEVGEIKPGHQLGYVANNSCQYLPCVDCGKLRWVRLMRGKPENPRCKSCAAKIRREFPPAIPSGDKSPNWKGGRYIGKDGYVKIKVAKDDPFYLMVDNSGYVLEHRLVVARNLNRCLSHTEVVHHKNGNRSDNRLENLELVPDVAYHMREHSKGYRAGYEKGLKDGMSEQIEQLKKEIRLLRWELKVNNEEVEL